MNKELTIDPKKLYTKSEYSKAYQISRPTIDKQIDDRTLKTIQVNGTILIVAK
jgi:hypothetical protein